MRGSTICAPRSVAVRRQLKSNKRWAGYHHDVPDSVTIIYSDIEVRTAKLPPRSPRHWNRHTSPLPVEQSRMCGWRRHNRDRTKLSSAKRKLVALPPPRKATALVTAQASGFPQQAPASRRVPTAPGPIPVNILQAASWVRAPSSLQRFCARLAPLLGDEGPFTRSSDAGEACDMKMVADGVQD
jgi:hypothetical protein